MVGMPSLTILAYQSPSAQGRVHYIRVSIGGVWVIYHDLLEFTDPQVWMSLTPQLVAYYQAHAADLP
jgi:hypothetical protein